jgi:virginiamycin B lyase
MRFNRVLGIYAATATAGAALLGVTHGTAWAQSEVLDLTKFPAGFDTTPAPVGPIDIAAGPDGNMWFTNVSGIDQISVITPDGRISNFSTGFIAGSKPTRIIAGPDGDMWFTDTGKGGIGQITTNGAIDEFVIEENGASVIPNSFVFGSDNNLWFTDASGVKITRMALDGAITVFSSGITASAGIQEITSGPDGNLWFTEAGSNRIGSITPQGRIFEFGTGISPEAGLFGITAGPDGNLWFTETKTGKIGRITTAGAVTEFETGLAPSQGPFSIKAGPDGNLWFTEQGGLDGDLGQNRIGRITTGGVVTEIFADTPNLDLPGPTVSIAPGPGNTIWFTQTLTNFVNRVKLSAPTVLAASVLPGGRTVSPGQQATVFATMANGGASALSNCQVNLPADAPLGLQLNYQTTNPATNAVTGTVNTPFTLAASGGSQSLLLTFQSPSPVFAPGLDLNFNCNGVAAAVTGGVNTMDVNFSADAAPDDIVLASSATPGMLSVPLLGSGAFSVAMQNAGGSEVSTNTLVSVDTGLAILPVTATICRTNPSTGACLDTPETSQFFNLPSGTTATFSVFVTANGTVPFDPSNNRVFVRFIDFDQTLNILVSHGSASVALQTTN